MAEQPQHPVSTAADMDGMLVEKALIVYREQIAKNRDALDRRLRLIDTNLAALRKSREGEQIVLEDLPDAGHWEIVDPHDPKGAGITVDFQVAKEDLPPFNTTPSSFTRKTDVPKTETVTITPHDIASVFRARRSALTLKEIVAMLARWKEVDPKNIYSRVYWHLSKGRERRWFTRTTQGWTLAAPTKKQTAATKKVKARA